jgi:glycosyltransferase involved in cell wall biosynthesis
MKPEITLWIDVTTLMHWQRPAVGIVRVEQQLCLWLLHENPPGLGFCCYSKAQHQFYPLSHEEVRGHLTRIEQCSLQRAADAVVRPSFKQQLIRRIKAFLDYLPPVLSTRLMNLMQRLRPHARRAWYRLAALRAGRRQEAPPASILPVGAPPLTFAPGSVYVSLGLDWDHKDMADIYRKKQAHGFRCLFMCYDIIPVLLPHLCVGDVSRLFAHYFADLAWTADRILCISHSTRRDLLALLDQLGVPERSAEVIRLGGDILPAAQSPAASSALAPHLTQPYVLFVSTIERRKNHEVLYRAWRRLAAEGIALPQLIFVGMPGWGVGDLFSDIALDPLVAGRITVLNHVGDEDLALLYQHALFTVYPSLYEGWGLPVAESLAFGKYCLCANTASLPEVGEDFVDYLDPWDLPAWVDKLRFLLTHPAWVEERNARIARDYRPHPWRATAQEIYQHARQLHAPD